MTVIGTIRRPEGPHGRVSRWQSGAPLARHSSERIDKFAKLLSEGRKPKTVNNVLAVLGRLLRFAIHRGALGVAPPVGKLTLPPGRDGRQNIIVEVLLARSYPASAPDLLATCERNGTKVPGDGLARSE